MTNESFKRKLSAILSADVAGYSRLMAEDEAATVKTIATYREIMASLIKQHRGRVVDSPGDNVLAEFSSVVDSVQCAVAVQNEIQARNAELPENRRMQFRIGINLGDVIDEDDRIYGDGVNIAARLEAMADPGGICVSKTAFDQIETKLPLGYEYLGEQSVKNIPKPVGAYRVLMQPRVTVAGESETEKPANRQRKTIIVGAVGLLFLAAAVGIWQFYIHSPSVEPASVEKMAYPLPDKASIAVLPFDNLRGDSEQDYLADGISDNIITALSKVPDMFVIARNSTFTFKDKPMQAKQIAEELGVRFILEGSVQKAENRMRINVQLIDAIKGHHLWAERYDRDLKDVFLIQDEITKKVLTSLQVKLTIGQDARIWAKSTNNLDAYLKALQAGELIQNFKPENLELARQLSNEAIALDPNYATAYMCLAGVHIAEIFNGLSKNPRESGKQALNIAQKALALNENAPEPYLILGILNLMQRQHEKAIAAAQRAIELNPNSAYALYLKGRFLMNAGRPEESFQYFKQSKRLNPYAPSSFYINYSCAYWLTKQYDEAIAECQQGLERNPDDMWLHLVLAAAQVKLGKIEKARASVKEAIRINPKVNLEWLERVIPWKNKADVNDFTSTIRDAGLK
jgi:TolB-like protein/class 3 adenylate cyclase/Tfp pilus assembly protein PilF